MLEIRQYELVFEVDVVSSSLSTDTLGIDSSRTSLKISLLDISKVEFSFIR